MYICIYTYICICPPVRSLPRPPGAAPTADQIARARLVRREVHIIYIYIYIYIRLAIMAMFGYSSYV